MKDNESISKSSMYILIVVLWCCSFFFLESQHNEALKLQREEIKEEYETIDNIYFDDYCKYIDYKTDTCKELKIKQESINRTIEEVISGVKK